MEPLHPQTPPTPPQAADGHDDYHEEEAAPAARRPAPPAKPTPTELLRRFWLPLAGFIVLLIIGGLALWLRTATQQAHANPEPVAATSANIEPSIAAPETTPAPETVSPSSQLEAQRRAEQDARSLPAGPNSDEVFSAFAVDTAQAGARRRLAHQRAAAASAQRAEAARLAAANVDTVETTVQDPSTGMYRAATVLVPRRRVGSPGTTSPRAGSRGLAALPARDTDGTPFETDPDVLRMLAASSQTTRDTYEKTTGKRYRDPEAALAMLAARSGKAAASVPGLDGFFTVKVGSSARVAAGAQAEQLTPDVFFKCGINGEQKVRTGSVVLLRLLEDAVVSGVTFPKNMVFASVASVGANNVTLAVNRLGATRVQADIFDFNYMPGIMIDPVKKVAKDASYAGQSLQQQSTQEISTAIDRSASAANSVVGVSGRLATTLLARPRARTKLREVLLPDGYPILITTAVAAR
ncbi:MAG: conjugative transposon protein TraM [Janthinobacterium lividum]